MTYLLSPQRRYREPYTLATMQSKLPRPTASPTAELPDALSPRKIQIYTPTRRSRSSAMHGLFPSVEFTQQKPHDPTLPPSSGARFQRELLHPLFAHPHVSSRCTAGSLLHLLAPCGHTVVTEQPEVCSANCATCPDLHANKECSVESFACSVCIDQLLDIKLATQKDALEKQLSLTEQLLGGPASDIISQKRAAREQAWVSDRVEDRKNLLALGRSCMAIVGAEGQPSTKNGMTCSENSRIVAEDGMGAEGCIDFERRLDNTAQTVVALTAKAQACLRRPRSPPSRLPVRSK
ncbi:hypothetical protein BJ546DRAFT_416717 [Cryomyces antarcticus]